MTDDSLSLHVATWSGTLPELVAAAESGAVTPASLPLGQIVRDVRAASLDLERRSVAYAQLARLIELKARALLPNPPPEAPAAEADAEAEAQQLAERLVAYRLFAEAAAALREFEQRRSERFGRPPGTGSPSPRRQESVDPGLEPGPQALDLLLQVFAEVWERAQPRLQEVQRDRQTLAQAVQALRARLSHAGTTEFSALFSGDADRLEVVVTFLALLELVRLGEVQVRQDAPFGTVGIGWLGPRNAAPGDGP